MRETIRNIVDDLMICLHTLFSATYRPGTPLSTPATRPASVSRTKWRSAMLFVVVTCTVVHTFVQQNPACVGTAGQSDRRVSLATCCAAAGGEVLLGPAGNDGNTALLFSPSSATPPGCRWDLASHAIAEPIDPALACTAVRRPLRYVSYSWTASQLTFRTFHLSSTLDAKLPLSHDQFKYPARWFFGRMDARWDLHQRRSPTSWASYSTERTALCRPLFGHRSAVEKLPGNSNLGEAKMP